MEFNQTSSIASGSIMLSVILSVAVIYYLIQTTRKYHALKQKYSELYHPLITEIQALNNSFKSKSILRLDLVNRYLFTMINTLDSIDKNSLVKGPEYMRLKKELYKLGAILEGEFRTLHLDLYAEDKHNQPLTEVVDGYIKALNHRIGFVTEPMIIKSDDIVDKNTLGAVLKIAEIACKDHIKEFKLSSSGIELFGLSETASTRIKAVSFAYKLALIESRNELRIAV